MHFGLGPAPSAAGIVARRQKHSALGGQGRNSAARSASLLAALAEDFVALDGIIGWVQDLGLEEFEWMVSQYLSLKV